MTTAITIRSAFPLWTVDSNYSYIHQLPSVSMIVTYNLSYEVSTLRHRASSIQCHMRPDFGKLTKLSHLAFEKKFECRMFHCGFLVLDCSHARYIVKLDQAFS